VTSQSHEAKTRTGIRLGVWLLLFCLLAVATIILCFPRHESARGVTEGAEGVSAVHQDRVVTEDRWRAKPLAPQRRMSTAEPTYGGRALTDWLADSMSTNSDVVVPAAKVLYELGADASPLIPHLATLLNSSNHCNHAVRLLVSIGTNSLPVLLDALAHNSTARQDVAGFIGQFGEAASDAIPTLLQCLRDADSGVRGSAMGALGNICTRPDIVVPALVNCLADPDVMLRMGAAAMLSRYGTSAAAAVPVLVSVAREDPDEQVRKAAAESLRAVAPERADAEEL
jgi:hypothetical protein